jgi:hypothetical protein
VRQDAVSEDRSKPDPLADAKTPKPYAMHRVSQTKLMERDHIARAPMQFADESM